MNNEIIEKDYEHKRLKSIILKFIIAWSVLVVISLIFNILHQYEDVRKVAEATARGTFEKDRAFRFWAAYHGGVYVPIDKRTQPNPNLTHIEDRDILKPNGTKLTLMNPAYMVRQISNEYSGSYGTTSRITSLKYLYDGNKPDEWETKSLKSFEKGNKESYEYTKEDGKRYLRLMRPLHVEQRCLKCHAFQGYKLGDVRGGVGVFVPLEALYDGVIGHIIALIIGHIVLWLLVLGGIRFFTLRELKYIDNKEKIHMELRTQEEIMIAQSRHAAMGEMISMIAHQWRQPISVIAMGANNIMADIELDLLDEKNLKNYAKDIIGKTQELSKTIDDFRNFFRPGKELVDVLVTDVVDDALSVVGKSLENNSIDVTKEFNTDKKIKTYSRELMQVLINIIKNAKEVIVEKEAQERNISISVDEKENNIVIKVCDSGGGIDEDIIDKIYDPYFSTKSENIGTGLGLYMSKTIIEKHLNGTISAYNKDNGACFEILLPLSLYDSGEEDE